LCREKGIHQPKEIKKVNFVFCSHYCENKCILKCGQLNNKKKNWTRGFTKCKQSNISGSSMAFNLKEKKLPTFSSPSPFPIYAHKISPIHTNM